MEDKINITKGKQRINIIEDVLASVASGDMDARIESDYEDDFTGIEAAINLLIDDLTDELNHREKIQQEL